MFDLPAEWLDDAEELGPHGKPIPPDVWTPEREAAVAAWRDELMAAGEQRDIEHIESILPILTNIWSRHISRHAAAEKLKVEECEIAYWYSLMQQFHDKVSEIKDAKRTSEQREKIERDALLTRQVQTLVSQGVFYREIAKRLGIKKDYAHKLEAQRRLKEESQCTSPSDAKSASAPTPSTCEPDSAAERRQTIA